MKGVEMLVGNFEFNSVGLGGGGVVKKERLEDFQRLASLYSTVTF